MTSDVSTRRDSDASQAAHRRLLELRASIANHLKAKPAMRQEEKKK